jgi:hypothetical protein
VRPVKIVMMFCKAHSLCRVGLNAKYEFKCRACNAYRQKGGPAKGCLQDMLFAIEADCRSGCWAALHRTWSQWLWAALHRTTLWNADVKHMKNMVAVVVGQPFTGPPWRSPGSVLRAFACSRPRCRSRC